MKRFIITLVLLTLMSPFAVLANDAKIKSAESAAPSDISSKATIVDWKFNVLRQGSNGWTCLPDMASSPGNDPWCVNQAWVNFLKAYLNHKKPSYNQVGVAYMMRGDTPVSNSDPYASKKTNDADWVVGLGAHLMVLIPTGADMSSYPTEWRNGEPWIMWKTPLTSI